MKLRVTPNLSNVLKIKGYKSQLEFANKFGFSQKTINAFDRSVQHRDELLFAVAKALDVNVEELFIVEEIPDETE